MINSRTLRLPRLEEVAEYGEWGSSPPPAPPRSDADLERDFEKELNAELAAHAVTRAELARWRRELQEVTESLVCSIRPWRSESS